MLVKIFSSFIPEMPIFHFQNLYLINGSVKKKLTTLANNSKKLMSRTMLK